ncbi:MAG: alpha-galactosidase [Planctomycetes bacterium]|nr:alpha-galactosidase [Planctomycetota bacterium]
MALLTLLALLQDVTFESENIRVRVDPFGRFTILREDVPVLQDVELQVGGPDWPGRAWEDTGFLPPSSLALLPASGIRLLRPPVRDIRKTDEGVTVHYGRGIQIDLLPVPGRASCVIRLGVRPERETPLEVLRLVGRTKPQGTALVNSPGSWDTIPPRPTSEDRINSRSMLLWGTETSATLVGFLRHRIGFNALSLDPTGLFEAFSWFGACVLKGASELDPLEVSWGPDPHRLQRDYLDRVLASLPSRPRPQSPLVGWCSFEPLGERVNEDDILRNAEFIARNLKHVRYVQIDRGYQRLTGNWETNEKFPHGHRWLSDKIRAMGLKPAILVAPFLVSGKSEVFVQHPDWMMRANGLPLVIAERGDVDGKLYGLDPTHPEVQAWLGGLIRRMVHEWGYEMLKLDAIQAPLMGRTYTADVTPVQAYIQGLKTIRDNAGDALLVGCSGPMFESIGLLDGMYTGCDLDRTGGTLAGTLGGLTSRYALNGSAWWNFSDAFAVRPAFSIAQARTLASLISVTGQTIWLADDLPQLPPDRLDILRRALPPAPIRDVRPLDIFGRAGGGTPVLRRRSDTIELPRTWKFSKGDDARWSAPDFDDGGWEEARLPHVWNPPYDGTAWYRVRFKATQGEAILELGKIDDHDETYLNGVKIGETSGWTAFRIYKAKLEGENTLAIRVHNQNGRGGVYATARDTSAEAWHGLIENYEIFALFNYSDAPKSHRIPLRPNSCAYETWSGEFRRDVDRLEDVVEPKHARVWVVRPIVDRPQVIANPDHITGWGTPASWTAGTLTGSGEALIDAAGDTPDRPLERRGELLYVSGEPWTIHFSK